MKDLTPKQAEVLAWVAAGKTNWEVAKIIGKSERCVHAHMHLVCQKLQVPNRTAAAVKFIAPDWWESKRPR